LDTGASNYIRIYTPYDTSTECNQRQRHSGKWDDTRYRLEPTYDVIVYPAYIRMDGLQIKIGASSSYPRAVSLLMNSASSDVRISNNIIRANFSGVSGYGYGICGQGSYVQNVRVGIISYMTLQALPGIFYRD